MRKLAPVLVLLISLSGCLTTPTETPRTAKESLIALEYTYQAAMGTIQNLFATGVINKGNAQKFKDSFVKAQAAMESARIAVTLAQDDALSKVQLANTLVVNFILVLDKEKEGG